METESVGAGEKRQGEEAAAIHALQMCLLLQKSSDKKGDGRRIRKRHTLEHRGAAS